MSKKLKQKIPIEPEEQLELPLTEPQKEKQELEIIYEFRFIKLANGDDILCQLSNLEIEGHIFVRLPLKVSAFYDPNLDEAVYMFVPWVPFTDQELVPVTRASVITITSIKENVKAVYLKRIDAFQKALTQVNLPDSMDTFAAEKKDEEDALAAAKQAEDDDEVKSKKPKVWVN